MATYRIWPSTDGPNTATDDSVQRSLATEFYVTSPAWVTHLHHYRGTTDVAPSNARVYRVDSESTGTVVAEITSLTPSGTGWQTYALASPVALTANQRYRVAFHYPFVGPGIGMYTRTSSYWVGGGGGAGGITNGILVAPDGANATGTDQGSFSDNALAFPTLSFDDSNYWSDVTITDVVDGALSATLPALTADLDGTLTNSGTLAGQLATLTGALTGQVTDTGTLAAQLPNLITNLVGQIPVTGQLAAALPMLTASLTDAVTTGWPPRAGSVTITGVATATVSIT